MHTLDLKRRALIPSALDYAKLVCQVRPGTMAYEKNCRPSSRSIATKVKSSKLVNQDAVSGSNEAVCLTGGTACHAVMMIDYFMSVGQFIMISAR